ncbi:hypothetical protein [Roseateles sp.]|uniref:hypothetical protein n=1 Tax=Roseateles sp. TaxID=1971397 RepID=UPI0032649F68
MSALTFNRRLLAGLATLTLAAAPAWAQSNAVERVEIRGRIVDATARYDVHAACDNLDEQLLSALARTWADEGRYGEVKVQLVLENGRIGTVKAQGISIAMARKVRAAVNRLSCTGQDTAGAEIYRFSVDFTDPEAPASNETRTASSGRVRISG